MLQTNLSTRPFYNERVVHLLLGVVAAFIVMMTIFNLSQVVLLSRRHSELSAQSAAAEARVRDLKAHAAQTQQVVNTKQFAETSALAREAGEIINQRLFSWTDLLNRLETTLPDDVRIAALRPMVGQDGSLIVQMTVTGRAVEDIERFMANLEKTDAFSAVFPREDMQTEDGLVEALVEGKYAPSP